MLQKIRVLVQRRPQLSIRTLCPVCASSQSHACDSPFSQHPEHRSCTPWPDSCTTLCPSLCDPGPLPQAPEVHSLPDPTIPQLCRRGNQSNYEIPTRSAAIPVCLHRNLKVTEQLGIHFRRPTAKFTGLLISPMSLITHSAILGS